MAKGSDPALKWKDWPYSRVCRLCKRTFPLAELRGYRIDRVDSKIVDAYVWCMNCGGA